MTLPVLISNARICPSIDGEITAPGITVGGDLCALEHPGFPAHEGFGGGACHATFPVAGSSANNPPPLVGCPRTESASGANTSLSTGLYAIPHWIPPPGPPLPILVCQTILPCLSGSNPHTTADFWPARMIWRPRSRSARIGEAPKSTSVPAFCGQFPPPPRAPQSQLNISGFGCCDHFTAPVSRSIAMIASAVWMSGSEYPLPVAT